MPWINKDKCIGCGICVNICSEGIEIVNGKASIKNENANCLKDAARDCPRKAIILEGKNEKTESNKDIIKNFDKYGQGAGRGGEQGFNQGRGMGAGRGRGLGMGPRDGRGRGRGGGGRKRE